MYTCICMSLYKEKNLQLDIQKNRIKDRQTDRQTDRQIDRQTDRDKKTNRERVRERICVASLYNTYVYLNKKRGTLYILTQKSYF